MKENKMFNLRIMFLVFVCFITGILSAVFCLTHTWLGIVILSLSLIILIFCCVKNKISFIVAIICGVSILLGGCGVAVEKANFERSADFNNVVVCGEIIDYSTNYSNYTSLIIDNVKLDNSKFDGNVLVEYNGENLFLENPIGYKVSFVAIDHIKIGYIEDDEINSYHIKNDIRYIVSTDEIIVGKRKEDLKIKLQDKIKQNLILGLGNGDAVLMYSSIFGDKSGLEYSKAEMFTASGVAHILAVSGLHVGLVVACLTFILKLFRANKQIKTTIISLFLLFYCYVCGWSFSVVRATIMAIVLLVSSLCCREYDSLNSISLAGLIILIISPSALFDAGFLLSFMCVLGISMFYKPFSNCLIKLRCNNKIMQGFIISIITNISIFMITACFFNEVNIIGIFANTIILPLFSVAFVLCFIISLFSLPFGFFIYLLKPLTYLVEFIELLIFFFSRFDILVFETRMIPNIAVYLYAGMLFFISRYCLASKSKKLIISSMFVLLIVCSSLSTTLV